MLQFMGLQRARNDRTELKSLESLNNRCVGMGHIVPRWVGIIVLGFQELQTSVLPQVLLSHYLVGYRLHHAYQMLQPSSINEESCSILLTLAFNIVIKSIYLSITCCGTGFYSLPRISFLFFLGTKRLRILGSPQFSKQY